LVVFWFGALSNSRYNFSNCRFGKDETTTKRGRGDVQSAILLR